MMALQLVLGSLQVRWKVRRYETSRWVLFVSMLLFSLHYLLQMTLGWRARGADIGGLFNILFYTPLLFAFTFAILNLKAPANKLRRYCLKCIMAYVLILIVFVIGVITRQSLHIGVSLYAMLALFIVSMVYCIIVNRRETILLRRTFLENFGADVLPFDRFAMVSNLLLCCTLVTLPIVILSNALLKYAYPLMLLTVAVFVQSFISLGYYLVPKDTEEIYEVLDEEDKAEGENAEKDKAEEQSEAVKESAAGSSSLSVLRIRQIEQALAKWCEERRYQDSNATIFSLADDIGCKKSELTDYFNQSAHTNFRTWLSDIRFNEAVRMMKACPEYSNDAISTECGFSSHTQIYRIFKQKTGLSPSQWRVQMS